MKKRKLLLLSILSGIIMFLGWPPYGFPILLFFGFVPLLFVEEELCSNKGKYAKTSIFLYSYLAFFVWNGVTTWWIFKSTIFGGFSALIVNPLLLTIPFYLFHITKRRFNRKESYLSLIFYWITYEFVILDWDLSWPWLNIGNGFAAYPKLIQWYEYTGCLGGTLWVLILNILFYFIIKEAFVKKAILKTKLKIITILALALPVLISLLIYYSYKEKKNPVSIVVVQPNIDPYKEKFGSIPPVEQLQKIINLAKTKVDINTDYVIGPETAIPEGFWENHIKKAWCIDSLNKLIDSFPQLKIVIGLSSYRMFINGEGKTLTARKYPLINNYFYDIYNTAMQIDSTSTIQLYHKSKLVPGVEKMPFPRIFKSLEKFAINMGGSTGSYGIQEERTVFLSRENKVKIAPVICYESAYGEFVSKYIINGANLIFIITNDGWWGNTAGYKQHLDYACLRAIETRRSIARSANTGISCFINQRGDIIEKSEWWTATAMKNNINTNSYLTFYVKYGDYIGRICQYLSYLSIMSLIILFAMRKIKH
ncbi:MAG: apolipoprotein N-acyltransferase [Bacteroidetes bacterium CG2_30_32_10]|nr:MAG: apolipoprotein N-acyltransferase [Bacteroidetes bacterium CG2_30_32_10]